MREEKVRVDGKFTIESPKYNLTIKVGSMLHMELENGVFTQVQGTNKKPTQRPSKKELINLNSEDEKSSKAKKHI